MFSVITGGIGSGKSLATSKIALELLVRNEKWNQKKKNRVIRKVYSNIKFSPWVENKYGHLLEYWDDLEQLISIRDADIIWDEISIHLDATMWRETTIGVKSFLRQHRKYGVDIYGNVQDFTTVDISARRLVQELWLISKLLGSRSPSATKPLVRRIWGLCVKRKVKYECYDLERLKYEFDSWELMFIRKKLCSVFDTRQVIESGVYPPLKHIERHCLTCGLKKASHV